MEQAAVREMAETLMAEHGLSEWLLVFDRAKRRAGVCRYAVRQIGISAPIAALSEPHDVRDTVLHEIAHALVGPRAGHGPVWKAKAREIGARPQRSSLTTTLPDAPWQGRCPKGHLALRFRAPSRVLSCKRCFPRFHFDHAFEWTYEGQPARMSAPYQAEYGRLSYLACVGDPCGQNGGYPGDNYWQPGYEWDLPVDDLGIEKDHENLFF